MSPHNANKAQEDSKAAEITQGTAKVTEFVGNTSAHSQPSSLLQLNADFHWEMGIISHMTIRF